MCARGFQPVCKFVEESQVFLLWPRSNPWVLLEEAPPLQGLWYHYPPVGHKQSCFTVGQRWWKTLSYWKLWLFISHFSLDDISQLIKALWYVSSGVPQSLVLSNCRFWSLVSAGPCMAKLNLKIIALQLQKKGYFPKTTSELTYLKQTNLWSKHRRTGSNAPTHHRLGYPAFLYTLANLVLLCTTDLVYQE